MANGKVVGLISDTHGLLRPEAIEALKGSDFIVHAGDIGEHGILAELERLAPVTAIRGNVDTGLWAQPLPETAALDVDGLGIVYVLHDIAELDLDPASAGFRVVVSGHSHKPGSRWMDEVLYVNPGSAGPRRFSLPVCVGRLLVDAGGLRAELIELRLRSHS